MAKKIRARGSVRYMESIRYWGGPLSEVPLYITITNLLYITIPNLLYIAITEVSLTAAGVCMQLAVLQ